ncbi:putative Beta-lactamase [Rubrivivax sp. A210]|uniref:tetratricopeptide repeat protein n=1 Tax=Rubrivivax sp. A210 TaxID=2772301 RepID=UPI001919CEE6|nr:tetratricopeptide repeat protein [Rubrivivax sp. A210]CAD5372294.1 putative Beta-lactamase [Rubrivivax sp. A210]
MKTVNCIVALALSMAVLVARADPLQDATSALQRKDYAAALKLLEPLARDGQPQAQLRLGTLYYHGHGVRESNELALQWYEKAARQGLADAQFLLGNMYAYGQAPVAADQDPTRLAAQWYFEAASQGHAEAQYSLGILFLTGSGVTQSDTEARKWIDRAAAAGHADAKRFQAGR